MSIRVGVDDAEMSMARALQVTTSACHFHELVDCHNHPYHPSFSPPSPQDNAQPPFLCCFATTFPGESIHSNFHSLIFLLHITVNVIST